MQKKNNSRNYSRTLTYLFLQKLHCPKCGNTLGGKATKKKNGNVYYYYFCSECKCNIKETVIEEINLGLVGKVYIVNYVKFRESVLRPLLELSKEGYIDRYQPAVYGCIAGPLRTSEYMPPEKVIQHLDRLRKFYDVYYYEAAYDTIEQVFYFDYVNLNKAIVRVFPVEDYKKIDPENKRRVHKLGIIYVIRDDGTLLKEEDDVFNYIPSKNDEKLIPVNTNSLKKESENQ